MAGSFFDTNILLYLASEKSRKADIAEQLLEAGGTISAQVLNEIANVTRRKQGWDWPAVRQFIETISELLTVVPVTAETNSTGIDLAERYGLSPYDAFIVAAALLAGCEKLLSEDMHDGLLIEKRLRITNPF